MYTMGTARVWQDVCSHMWGEVESDGSTLARLIARTANADFKELSATR